MCVQFLIISIMNYSKSGLAKTGPAGPAPMPMIMLSQGWFVTVIDQ